MSILTKLPAETYDREAFAGFVPQRDFLLPNAKALMWLSQLAFETDEVEKVATLLDRFGLSLVQNGVVSTQANSPLPIARTEAVVAEGRDAAFLAFAGTDPLVAANWATDFDIRPNADTTEGFTLALGPAIPKIVQLLRPGVPVFVTGHSLGGALAAVAALQLAKAGVTIAAVYTFGMQRPGDEQFKSDYDALLGMTTYRLVHGDDVVPSVPPSSFHFRHVGRLLHTNRGVHFDKTNLRADTSSDAPPFGGVAANFFKDFAAPFSGGVAELLNDPGPLLPGRPEKVKIIIRLLPQFIRDHLQDSYIAALA
ncbi:MAG: hypothetical protein JOZ16_15245 [Methylobacteriaceae bacterium]|nr:hypothetical protein [Methylobacteriaceae bacterium]